jgi:hypothetical protein
MGQLIMSGLFVASRFPYFSFRHFLYRAAYLLYSLPQNYSKAPDSSEIAVPVSRP